MPVPDLFGSIGSSNDEPQLEPASSPSTTPTSTRTSIQSQRAPATSISSNSIAGGGGGTSSSIMCQLTQSQPVNINPPLSFAAIQNQHHPIPISPSRLSTSRPPSSAIDHQTPPHPPPGTASTISSPAPGSPKHPHKFPFLRTPVPSRPSTPVPTRPPPVLQNVLTAGDGESILVIAVEDKSDNPEDAYLDSSKSKGRGGKIYGGSQGGDIHVWDLQTLVLRARLSGHEGAVLALQLVPERNWLISSSGDGTVRVWHTPTLTPLYIIHPPHDNIGDILCLSWVSTDMLEGNSKDGNHNLRAKSTGRLYAGTQDTCIQWIDLPPAFHLEAHSHQVGSLPPYLSSSHSASSSPPIHRTPNKFFDSISVTDRPRSRLSRNSNSATSLVNLGREIEGGSSGASSSEHVVELQFELRNMALYAHYGYIYCLAVGRSNDRNVLISGSGDEQLKVWAMYHNELVLLSVLDSSSDAVLSLAVRDNTVFAGHQGGVIRVWDLDTFTCVRDLRSGSTDILTLSVLGDDFYSGAADGCVQRWDKAFNVVSTWPAHSRTALASTTSTWNGRFLITGGNDAMIKIWDILDDRPVAPSASLGFQGPLFHSLSKLVSFRTIADETNREECRQGAAYLKRVLRDMGAEACLLPGAPGCNPLVLATFRANSGQPKKRVLCYGHYDVVPADDADKWSNDPFKMSGKNGWLYGRGVSDNKGPILAIAAAASELRAKQTLDVDLVMVIEGEEETGSAGFQSAIRKNRELIGDIDVILVSNSYWIGEDIPCLTFGLRGVIHATVRIQSNQPDLHSGMQGGVVSEPLVDMVRLLASLTDADGRVRIPGFLNDVRKLTQEESDLYDDVISRCSGTADKFQKNSHIADPRRSLITRWRQPALSIHKIDVAGPSQKTLIPSWATSSVSIRIVPDQSLLDIVEQLKVHLNKAFASLRTHNTLTVDINHVADWWLGDIDSPYFHALADCIESEWGVKPLFIREGGSIPSLPFLEREFSADAVQFPMGLDSDAAHLPDERIPIINLERGKNIVAAWFTQLASLS
ncbi:Zn-dependent exopeptidase [Meredithblackwellia eburnea MCA 4105]